MSNRWKDEFSVPSSASQDKIHQVGLQWLVIAAIATAILWQVPFGNYLLYPFTILATWFHEMGHGLTALLLGGDFQKLVLLPNGSGIAFHSGVRFLGGIGNALVSAGGPMGPPIAGAALILASRGVKSTRYGLLILGTLLIVSTLIWVRSLFGLLAVPLLGAGVLTLALNAPPWLQAFTIQFLGVQACISTYHQLDYLFTRQAVINGQPILSDSAQIAQNLLLPYWFWGTLMAIGSFLLLWQSLWITYRSKS